jgi:uncharacterized protein YndB with AHSA1/START domain
MTKRRATAHVRREIAARPREVFRAWTDPRHPATPWSRRHGIRAVVMRPRVGELFYVNMGPPMPLPTHFGRFLQLESPRRIEHTWASEGTRGAETRVRIELRPRKDGTLFSLQHSGLPSAESARAHEEGWGWIVGWLADGFESEND